MESEVGNKLLTAINNLCKESFYADSFIYVIYMLLRSIVHRFHY